MSRTLFADTFYWIALIDPRDAFELEIHTSFGERGRGGVWYAYLIEFANGRVVGLQHGPGHGILLPSPPLSKASTTR